MKRLVCSLALLLALSSAPALGPSALGQGCAMCWSSANAAGEGGKQALNRGITMLLIPTLGLMAGFIGLTVRYNREQRDDQDENKDQKQD